MASTSATYAPPKGKRGAKKKAKKPAKGAPKKVSAKKPKTKANKGASAYAKGDTCFSLVSSGFRLDPH